MSYCYHCMTIIENPDNHFCPECGEKHNVCINERDMLPGGTWLCGERYFVGKCISDDRYNINYIGFDCKLKRKIVVKEVFYRGGCFRNADDEKTENSLEVSFSDSALRDEIIHNAKKEFEILSDDENLNSFSKVYDCFSENNTVYVTEDFTEGITLYDWVKENGVFGWQELYEGLLPVMKGIARINENGIAHKNISPDNIILKDNGNSKLDFMLTGFRFAQSEMLNLDVKKTFDAALSGFENDSPYKLRFGSANMEKFSDVYSLAATIYYALAGENPGDFEGGDVYENFPRLKDLLFSGKITKSVGTALDAALQAEYRERCRSVGDFIGLLESGKYDKSEESEEDEEINELDEEIVIFDEEDDNVNDDFVVTKNESWISKNNYGLYDSAGENSEDEVAHTGKGMKQFLSLIIFVAALPLLTLGGFILYNHFNPPQQSNDDFVKVYENTVDMPSVVGLTYNQCMLVLNEKKFDVDVRKISSRNVDVDTVARQEPAAGAVVSAKEGEKFKVTVYVVEDNDADTDGFLLSPKCLDKDVDEAVRICEDLGLKVECYYQGSGDDLIGDVVIHQSPMYGEYISQDVTITLIVRRGKDRSQFYEIEDYFGLKYSDVKAELEDSGWVVESTEEERDDYNEGVIIGQSIEKGTIADMDEEAEISFVVAKEPKKSSKAESKTSSGKSSNKQN